MCFDSFPCACFSGSRRGGLFIQPPVSANYFWPPVVQHIQSLPGRPPCWAALHVLPKLFSLAEAVTLPVLCISLTLSFLSSFCTSLCLFLSLLFWSASPNTLLNKDYTPGRTNPKFNQRCRHKPNCPTLTHTHNIFTKPMQVHINRSSLTHTNIHKQP